MFTVKVKQLFFDRSTVIEKAGAARARALSKAGAYIRRVARNSIRNATRKRRVSDPGNPPVNRTGLLKKGIIFTYDPQTNSMVCGAAKFKTGNVPEVLEKGGMVKYTRITSKGARQRRKKIDARPYMAPALQIAINKGVIPDAFRDSIKG